MKLRLTGTENRLNVEHRTPNIERPILMTLRFIYFNTSEPQNIEYRTQNVEGWNRFAHSFFKIDRSTQKLSTGRIHFFDIRHSKHSCNKTSNFDNCVTLNLQLIKCPDTCFLTRHHRRGPPCYRRARPSRHPGYRSDPRHSWPCKNFAQPERPRCAF